MISAHWWDGLCSGVGGRRFASVGNGTGMTSPRGGPLGNDRTVMMDGTGWLGIGYTGIGLHRHSTASP
jgi:hypothetical protein